MTTYVGASTATARNHRAVSTRGDRAVLGKAATRVDGTAAAGRGAPLTGELPVGPTTCVPRATTASERGTLLTEDMAVGPTPGSSGHGTTSTTSRCGAAEFATGGRTSQPASRGTAAGVAPQSGAASSRMCRRLGRRVAAQCRAVAAQNGAAALATDAQSSTARRTSATLATDSDTCKGTRRVRRRCTVQRSALARDQSRLTVRAGAERRGAATTREATGIGCVSQPGAGAKTGLTTQTTAASKAAAGA